MKEDESEDNKPDNPNFKSSTKSRKDMSSTQNSKKGSEFVDDKSLTSNIESSGKTPSKMMFT
jgi:hypothetical protein